MLRKETIGIVIIFLIILNYNTTLAQKTYLRMTPASKVVAHKEIS